MSGGEQTCRKLRSARLVLVVSVVCPRVTGLPQGADGTPALPRALAGLCFSGEHLETGHLFSLSELKNDADVSPSRVIGRHGEGQRSLVSVPDFSSLPPPA